MGGIGCGDAGGSRSSRSARADRRSGRRANCDGWEHARDNPTDHPCRKPVPLLRRAIRTALPVEYRDPGRPPLVVYPFAGAFSTGVAAVEEGCRFLGVEMVRRYHERGEARLRAAADASRPARP